MANYEATKYDYSGANLTGIEGVNTGLIIPWSDATAPSGFLECNGDAVSRTTYSALFAIIGTTYGSGDGSTTFNVPDLQDRVANNTSPTKSFASTGGANTVTIGGSVNVNVGNRSLSTPQIGSHSHPSSVTNMGRNYAFQVEPPQATWQLNQTVTIQNRGGGGAHSHPRSANFSGGSNSVLQPYLTLMYIIKA